MISELAIDIKKQFNYNIPLKADSKYIYNYEDIKIRWSDFNSEINPLAGGLPEKRIERKSQELENFLHVFKTQIYPGYKMKKDQKYLLTIVDFCSG